MPRGTEANLGPFSVFFIGDDKKAWQAMRTQLNDILAQEQTLQAFMDYLVDDQRSMT